MEPWGHLRGWGAFWAADMARAKALRWEQLGVFSGDSWEASVAGAGGATGMGFDSWVVRGCSPGPCLLSGGGLILLSA